MSNIKLFNDKKIRTYWDAENEEWYFSVVDIVAILTESADPKQYIKKMRSRDPELANKWGTICTPVEMYGLDGRRRKIQAMNTEGVLRLVQSIPSPKAEPFKMWLAKVGSERLDEIADPEKAILRGADFYRKKGYPEEWINQRMLAIKTRKKLTDEWKERGITESKEYAILTDEMTSAWSGMTVRQYKKYKDLHKENLRDNMTDIELVLNMLAEVTTTGISKAEKPKTFDENKAVARSGGRIARNARLEYEQRINQSVISPLNARNKELLDTKNSNLIEDK